MINIKELSERAYQNSKDHGFWDGIDSLAPDVRNMALATKLCLIHSEVSEAMEELRLREMTTTFRLEGKPIGFPSELADIFIRLVDLCEFLDIDLEEEVLLKMKYNESRPIMHGGKAF